MKPLLKDVIIPKTIRETDAVIYTRKVFNTGFTPYYEMVLAITKCINGKEVVFVIAGNNAGNVYEQRKIQKNCFFSLEKAVDLFASDNLHTAAVGVYFYGKIAAAGSQDSCPQR